MVRETLTFVTASLLVVGCGGDGSSANDCADNSDCAGGEFCLRETCVPTAENGEACSGGGECNSGYCSDGVCCDTACEGECDSCSIATGAPADGICEVIASGQNLCSAGICDGSSGQCTTTCVSETLSPIPAAVDVIIVVDNSASMPDEIDALEKEINTSFAEVMDSLGIDYQIVMLTRHGPGSYDVCIPPPLSDNASCSAAPANVLGQFYHYSVAVGSHDAPCLVLATLFGEEADDFGLAPNGWAQWLRSEAHKAFIALTDDGTTCNWNLDTYDDEDQVSQGQSAAADIDDALLAASPTQFGTRAARNYSWYSFVGLEAATPGSASEPWLPSDPVTANTCATAVGPGTAYQWLSKGTDALRFPMCEISEYDLIFEKIATDLSMRFFDPCQLRLPSPPPGQSADTESLVLSWDPPATPKEVLSRVTDETSCADGDYFVAGEQIELCPAACSMTSAQPDGLLEAHYACN